MGKSLFADPKLAVRIERAEAMLSAGLGENAMASGTMAGCFVEPVGGGVAVYAGPDSPVSKIIGTGLAEMPDPERWQAIEFLYFQHGAVIQAEVATLADPAWHAELCRRGYLPAGFENVLGIPLQEGNDSLPRKKESGWSGLSVSSCRREEDRVWLDVLADGFARPDVVPAEAMGQTYPREAIERIFEDFAAVSGFRRYLARIGGVAAGGASMRVSDGIAQLCGAATLPEWRRRGVQTALMDFRLREARAEGCDRAVVTVAPGSKSQENAHRQGFSLLYARAIYRKSGAISV